MLHKYYRTTEGLGISRPFHRFNMPVWSKLQRLEGLLFVTLGVKRFLFCSDAVGIESQAQTRADHFRYLILVEV